MKPVSSSPLRKRVGVLCALWMAVSACGGEGESDAADGGAADGGAAGNSQETSAVSERFPPFVATGQPLSAPDKVWTYIEFPDTKCRDGSPAGIGVSLNSASKGLMIYLEGGGACFDSLTCLANPANNNAAKSERAAGILDRSQPENPVRDWNFVYVPYCTGDTHGGTKPNAMVPGVNTPQQFVGYLNMQAYLQRIVPTLPDASDVLLTGVSAGGFGAGQNGILVQRAFPKVKVRTIDDSGPAMSSAIVPECLQQKWRETWGLDGSVLADCGADCPNPNDFSQPFALAMARLFNDRPTGLIESTRDGTISAFFGAGLNNCTGTALLNRVPAMDFEADLLAYREKVRPYTNFGTYLPAGTQHTWLGGPGLYTASSGGVRLIDWITKIVRGESPGHVGP